MNFLFGRIVSLFFFFSRFHFCCHFLPPFVIFLKRTCIDHFKESTIFAARNKLIRFFCFFSVELLVLGMAFFSSEEEMEEASSSRETRAEEIALVAGDFRDAAYRCWSWSWGSEPLNWARVILGASRPNILMFVEVLLRCLFERWIDGWWFGWLKFLFLFLFLFDVMMMMMETNSTGITSSLYTSLPRLIQCRYTSKKIYILPFRSHSNSETQSRIKPCRANSWPITPLESSLWTMSMNPWTHIN